jgi:hypothetical protein
MRKVVDSNYLEKPELREYLAASRKNVVVVTDYLELEMLGRDTLEQFLRSTEILAQYPRQVILSKTTDVAGSLRGKKKGLKKRLTDGKRTHAFRKWCRIREKIKRGEKSFENQRLKAREEAQAHLGVMLDNAANFKDGLKAHAERYTAEELRIIRAHEPFTPELTAKLVDGIMDFAQGFFETSPDHPGLPPANEVPYSFIFRFALCAYLHAFHWIYASGVNDRPLEKFRNDMIDVAIVAYATCFDGMFTNDKMATGVYKNANYLLKSGFLREDLMPKPASKLPVQPMASADA